MAKNNRKSLLEQVNDDNFRTICAESHSYQSIAKAIGYRVRSGTVRNTIMCRIRNLEVDTSHFVLLNKQKVSEGKSTYRLDDLLVEDSNYSNIHRLKIRLVAEDRLAYVCACCGNSGEWAGKRLNLQLDHKNGKPNDHRIENIRFLCPNCHSQTENFCGKNIVAKDFTPG